jgi:hypothetical protein
MVILVSKMLQANIFVAEFRWRLGEEFLPIFYDTNHGYKCPSPATQNHLAHAAEKRREHKA